MRSTERNKKWISWRVVAFSDWPMISPSDQINNPLRAWRKTRLVSWQAKTGSSNRFSFAAMALSSSSPLCPTFYTDLSLNFKFDGNPVHFSSKDLRQTGKKGIFPSPGKVVYYELPSDGSSASMKNEANREKKGISLEGGCPL